MKKDYANDIQWLNNRVSITPSGFFGSSKDMIQAQRKLYDRS